MSKPPIGIRWLRKVRGPEFPALDLDLDLDLAKMNRMMFPEAVIYKKMAGMKLQTDRITPLPESIKKGMDLKVKETPVAKFVLPVPLYSKVSKTKTLKDNYDAHFLMAQVYANSGDYDKASGACQKAISVHAHSATSYLLLAHIAEARGNDEEAKVMFKKAIYLDSACIAAYYELGGLYEKENDLPRARKARSTAIELLKYLPSQAVSVEPYDISAGELLKNLEYLTGEKDAALRQAGSGEGSR